MSKNVNVNININNFLYYIFSINKINNFDIIN